MKNRLMYLFLGVGLTLLIPAMASAQATKVNVCHVTGNGAYLLINVAARALPAHLAHGDARPGDSVPGNAGYVFSDTCEAEQVTCEYSVTPTGSSYLGRYGGTVTPVTITNEDCSVIDARRTDTAQGFAGTGWAGWSCVELGYPKVVGGGVTPDGATVTGQGAAKFGAAAVAGYNYPVYPHYTFNGGSNTPGGEEGWVAQAAPLNKPTGLYVICGQ